MKNERWEAYKPEIKRLYITEGKSKEKVMKTMELTHGFVASYVKLIFNKFWIPFFLTQDIESGNTKSNSKNGDLRKITAEKGPGYIIEKGAKEEKLKRNRSPICSSIKCSNRLGAFKLGSAGMHTSQRYKASS